jgi:hypothetical protein
MRQRAGAAGLLQADPEASAGASWDDPTDSSYSSYSSTSTAGPPDSSYSSTAAVGGRQRAAEVALREQQQRKRWAVEAEAEAGGRGTVICSWSCLSHLALALLTFLLTVRAQRGRGARKVLG